MAESLVALMAMLGTTAATAAPAAGASAAGLIAPSVGGLISAGGAGAGLGSSLLSSFLGAGAAKAGSGLVGELFPQNQMPRPPNLGLLSAPMASELGVPSYKRLQGNLVIPQGGPQLGGGGGESDDLKKLVQLLRQRGLV